MREEFVGLLATVTADAKLTDRAEARLTHLGDDGGFFGRPAEPGATSRTFGYAAALSDQRACLGMTTIFLGGDVADALVDWT